MYVIVDGIRVADVVESEVYGHKFSNWLKIDLKNAVKTTAFWVKHRKADFIKVTFYFGSGASPGLVRVSFSDVLANELLSGSLARDSVTVDSSSSVETNKK